MEITLCKLPLFKRRTLTKTLFIMKLTALLLLAACLQLSAKGLTQSLTISKQNASLQELFKEIEKQTGYQFFYKKKVLDDTRPVTINVRDESLEKVLHACFKDQPVTYNIVDKIIVVTVKQTADLQSAVNTIETNLPPPIDISGRVTDPDGNPLAGANIKVKGTKIGTTTNENGEFQLAGISENAMLEISFVGYETYTVTASNPRFKPGVTRNSSTIALKIKPENLNEVVVNKGYYTEKQKYSVGNSVHIDSKVIEQQPVQNPILALQGRVPGLFITQQSGLSNGDVTFRIQGQNSIVLFRNEHFVVVDGVPYLSQFGPTSYDGPFSMGGTPLSYINPMDIESVDVLKDADATAIYGSRAANGAILITTKKGKIGKSRVNVNMQQGWGKVTRKVDMLNTRQYLDMRYEAYKNDGINLSTLTSNSSNYDLTLWDTTRYTDWQKTLIGGTAHYNTINASVSGGSSTMQYLVGGYYNRQTTVFPGDLDDKRGGVHFNLGGSSGDQKFKIQLSGSYLVDENHLPQTDLTWSAIRLEPNAPSLYKTDGTLNWELRPTGAVSWLNPLRYLYNTYNNITRNLITSSSLSLNLLPGLDLKSNFGYTNLQSNTYLPIPTKAIRPDRISTTPLSASFSYRNMNSWIIEPQLVYNHRIKSKAELQVMLGTTIQQSNSDLLILDGSGYSSDLLLKSIKLAPVVTVANSSSSVYKYNALFGRVNFKWADKYVANFTTRRDGSSRFGEKNKFHNFGSIGLGWIFSQESFLQHTDFLSFGKLRLSYGTTGNDQIGDYNYLSLYGSTSGIPYQNTVGLQATSIPNPYLQWEETRKLQLGFDLGFIKDRVMLNASFVRNRSSNQLLSYTLPSITGFSSILENFPAKVQNISWEFLLNTVNVKKTEFTWNSSITLTIPRNKLISFPNIEKSSYSAGFNGVIVGQPVGVIKTYYSAGIDPSTGDYKVFDKKGNIITGSPKKPDDYTNLINTLPKIYGGFQNSISWRNIQFDFFFQFVKQLGTRALYYYNDGSIFPGAFAFGQGNSNQPVTILNRWQKPGDLTSIGRFTTMGNIFPWPISDDYTYDASYIRLKNVSISWQLPKSWQQKIHLNSGSIYVNAQNIATITNYTGLDPENQSSVSLPPLQVWTLGLKLGL
jgi:TonB-linked SusC/RagA family outer membrane protein